MKRFVAILLILLLSANICGATLTHHLCGKVFQYISLNGHKKDAKCCCKGSGMDKGCCKTTYFKVKIEDKKIAAHQYSLKPFSLDIFLPAASLIVPPAIGYVSESCREQEYIPQKVRWHREDLFIYYCVYRI